MKATYLINEVAQITHRHRNTILSYCRRGLISEPHREWNGWRVFTQEHIDQINALARADLQPKE